MVLGGNGFGDQKIDYREEDVLHWFRMVPGRPEMEDRRNWKNDGDGRRPEMEERRRTNGGRRWRTTVAEDGERRWPMMENDGGGCCSGG
jgi:hypothetical protein